MPVVTLEAFFVGNDDPGSIGCNLSDHPGTDEFYRVLRSVRTRPDVQDILIEIYEVDEDDLELWPFSERVYIFTSASQAEVEGWVAPLQPDEVAEGWRDGIPDAAPDLECGIKVYGVWWD